MQHKKKLLIFLTLISGFFLLLHQTKYQPLLSQGDHGRDLYCFQAVLEGKLPYRDFWWVYGPLMPYYYCIFYKLLGVSINSILWGKLIINLASGLFFFLILYPFIPALFVYVGTLWFLLYNLDFFFTYNHAGGITMLLAVTYGIFSYLQSAKIKHLYWALFFSFVLCLIKINFGIIALIILTFSTLITDFMNKNPLNKTKKFFYLNCAITVPSIVFLIYYILLHDLPIYVIRQCLPYHSSDHPHNAPIYQTLKMWWDALAININSSWPNRFFCLLILSSITIGLFMITRNKIKQPQKNQVIIGIGVFCVFYVANMHEFLVSSVLYRTFWAQPFSVLLIFFIIGFTSKNYSKSVQKLLFITIFIIVFQRYHAQVKVVQQKKLPQQYLSLEKGHIITGNDFNWFKTIEHTTHFLNTTLKEDETFFAIPYDCLYYYLTDKPSPSRQLIFFEHINIPEEQEKKIIAELEEKNVNYILVSSRAFSGEPGLGLLGETYCPIIGKYIRDNFSSIAMIGDLSNPPGWAWNHGVQIFKRSKIE